MSEKAHGKRIAILATNGFEESEILEPKRMLEEAGCETVVVSLEPGEIQGWKDKNWGQSIRVDKSVSDASADEFHGLLIPGGVINPDKLRMDPAAVQLVRDFFDSGKPIGAICHGPWLLAEADIAEGLEVTSWPSIKKDLKNAGANWVDREVVVDQGVVTSRKPSDIPAFGAKLIEEIGEGAHPRVMRRAYVR